MEPPQRPARLDGPLLPLPYETDPVLLALVTPTRVIHHHKVAEDTEDCQREVLAGCGLSGRAHGADLEGGRLPCAVTVSVLFSVASVLSVVSLSS